MSARNAVKAYKKSIRGAGSVQRKKIKEYRKKLRGHPTKKEEESFFKTSSPSPRSGTFTFPDINPYRTTPSSATEEFFKLSSPNIIDRRKKKRKSSIIFDSPLSTPTSRSINYSTISPKRRTPSPTTEEFFKVSSPRHKKKKRSSIYLDSPYRSPTVKLNDSMSSSDPTVPIQFETLRKKTRKKKK